MNNICIGNKINFYDACNNFLPCKLLIENITENHVVLKGGMRFYKCNGQAVDRRNQSYIEVN